MMSVVPASASSSFIGFPSYISYRYRLKFLLDLLKQKQYSVRPCKGSYSELRIENVKMFDPLPRALCNECETNKECEQHKLKTKIESLIYQYSLHHYNPIISVCSVSEQEYLLKVKGGIIMLLKADEEVKEILELLVKLDDSYFARVWYKLT